MPKPADGELDDESTHLFQRALYVEPLSEPIDLNKYPENGHEYIHQVRQETAALFPELKREIPMFCAEENKTVTVTEVVNPEKETKVKNNEKVDISQWKRKEARFFSELAIELRSKRSELMKKFPKKPFPSTENEKDICLFCLGSDLFKKIFKNENVDDASCHFPLLSIVLHLDQNEIFTILKYMSEWVDVIGMKHEVCRWIYALLACLQKPVSDDCEDFLEDFYDDCVTKIKKCDEEEKKQFHLISAILLNYFCVKAYTLGPSLEKFSKLC